MAKLPATLAEAEEAMRTEYARERLAAVRTHPQGDPFDDATRHALGKNVGTDRRRI